MNGNDDRSSGRQTEDKCSHAQDRAWLYGCGLYGSRKVAGTCLQGWPHELRQAYRTQACAENAAREFARPVFNCAGSPDSGVGRQCSDTSWISISALMQ